VQAAHDAGIVHRDLKPDNIFIVEKEGRPFVKILDFGVSKFDPGLTGGLEMTQEGATLGTPFYMSPEQIRGDKQIDARADIYALGVILYECVGGHRPFNADTLAHLAVLIHEGKPQPITDLRPEVPGRFAEVVHRAMAKDKLQRPASARELAESLASFTPNVLGPTVGWPGRGKGPPEPARPVESKKEGLLASASYGSGVAIPDSKVPRRSMLPMVLAGSGVAVIAVVLFFLNRPGPRKGAEDGQGIVSSATSPTATAVSPAATSVPSAAPEIASTSEPPAPSASAATDVKAPAKTATMRPGDKPPVHTDDNQKNSKSRVEQRGLAKDNPFK
jgi:serine/threonine-protein kinase